MYKEKAQNTFFFTLKSLNLAYGVKLNSKLKFLHLAHRYSGTKCPGKFIH